MYSKYIIDTEYPTDLWSYNFDYLWAVFTPKSVLILWKVIDEMLFTFRFTKNHTLQLAFPPFGRGNSTKIVEGLLQCMTYCQQWNERVGVVTEGILPHGQAWSAFLKRRGLYDGLSELLNVEFVREIHKLDSNVERISLGLYSTLKGTKSF